MIFFPISKLSLAIYVFVDYVAVWSSTPTLQIVYTADAELKNGQTSLPVLSGVWARSLPFPLPV